MFYVKNIIREKYGKNKTFRLKKNMAYSSPISNSHLPSTIRFKGILEKNYIT